MKRFLYFSGMYWAIVFLATVVSGQNVPTTVSLPQNDLNALRLDVKKAEDSYRSASEKYKASRGKSDVAPEAERKALATIAEEDYHTMLKSLLKLVELNESLRVQSELADSRLVDRFRVDINEIKKKLSIKQLEIEQIRNKWNAKIAEYIDKETDFRSSSTIKGILDLKRENIIKDKNKNTQKNSFDDIEQSFRQELQNNQRVKGEELQKIQSDIDALEKKWSKLNREIVELKVEAFDLATTIRWFDSRCLPVKEQIKILSEPIDIGISK